MVAGRCSELRGGILSIYEKNPICVTRDAMLSVSAERQREKDGERENEGKREGVTEREARGMVERRWSARLTSARL